MPAKTLKPSQRRTLKETPAVHYSVKRQTARDRRLAREADLERKIQEHVGKWVAIANGQVVAVGDTVEAVVAAARELGHEAPTVIRGPLTTAVTLYVFAA
jgi:hypothetical protein